jgi:hypothetical protein
MDKGKEDALFFTVAESKVKKDDETVPPAS